MSTVYLAGPISITTWRGATSWRHAVTEELAASGIGVRNPLRGKEDFSKILRGRQRFEHLWEGDSYKGIDNPFSSAHAITHRDHWDVMNCDALLANLSEAEKVSIGTVMEIAWAYAYRKWSVVVMDEKNIHWHGMVRTAASLVVPTLEAAVAAIITTTGGL